MPYAIRHLAFVFFAALLLQPTIAWSQTQTPPPPRSKFAPPLDVAAPPADAEKTASGLVTKVLRPGSGSTHPTPEDAVTAHYIGWTSEGKMFDTSHARKEPLSIQLAGLIPGWVEALQMMVPGEQRRLWVPENLAYGGAEGKPKGTLVFDIELVEVISLAAPPDVAAVPDDAVRRPSGLATKVITKGVGKIRPSPTSTVRVHYIGWTTDGKMFDSSYVRGRASEFQLDQVIKGWTEGVQLMVLGEKRRFWIPGPLAYEGNPQGPQGTLVFDVELIEIR
jgi:peptidylprolyl isomerase